jgi:hypothetical protein
MSLKLPVTQNDDEIGTITVSMDMEPMTGELMLAIDNGRPVSALFVGGVVDAPPEAVTEVVVEAPSDQLDTDIYVADSTENAD